MREILIDAKLQFDTFFEKLNHIKSFYRWTINEQGVIVGSFVYLNIFGDDHDYHFVNLIEAMTYPSVISDIFEFVNHFGLTWEEGRILMCAIDNDVDDVYFVPQIRKNLLIELGVEEND